MLCIARPRQRGIGRGRATEPIRAAGRGALHRGTSSRFPCAVDTMPCENWQGGSMGSCSCLLRTTAPRHGRRVSSRTRPRLVRLLPMRDPRRATLRHFGPKLLSPLGVKSRCLDLALWWPRLTKYPGFRGVFRMERHRHGYIVGVLPIYPVDSPLGSTSQ